ncbi:MAG: hypothetical protein NVSMB59_19990 [Vulcanimicrobiaceae bacterium]
MLRSEPQENHMNLRHLPVLAGLTLAIVPALMMPTPARAADATPAPAPQSTSNPATVPSAAQPAAAPTAKPNEDFLQRISVNFAPGYFFGSNSDAAPAPIGARTAHVFYDTQRRNADILRFDYGASFKVDGKTSIAFSHGNVAYQLGRIFVGNTTEISTGEIVDYTDTYAINHTVGGGLGLHVTYFNHQRSFGPDFPCLNSKTCQGKPFDLSINEHGYTFGGAYDFGPTTKIGKLMTAAADLKYVPRNGGPGNLGPTGVALGGLPAGSYGSRIVYPYSLTVKVPVLNDSTFVPFVNYTNLPVLYHDSQVPEAYRGIVFGVVKVINKNMTASYTNLNLQTCRCIQRVPPPDNLRLAFGILKLDFHTQL